MQTLTKRVSQCDWTLPPCVTGTAATVQMFMFDEGACYAPQVIWNSVMITHWGNTESVHRGQQTAYSADWWNVIPHEIRGDHPCFDPQKDIVVPARKDPGYILPRLHTRCGSRGLGLAASDVWLVAGPLVTCCLCAIHTSQVTSRGLCASHSSQGITCGLWLAHDRVRFCFRGDSFALLFASAADVPHCMMRQPNGVPVVLLCRLCTCGGCGTGGWCPRHCYACAITVV